MTLTFIPKARSDLIPSPPTYNTKYGYINWESYSNITYYTRLLPPIPEDCPLPMGAKGETYTAKETYLCFCGKLQELLSLQVNLFFLMPKSSLRGFSRDRSLGQILREPI